MWLKIVKVAAGVSAVLITLLFIALIVMVTRPVLLAGVSGGDLAYSLRGGPGATCQKEGSDWVCQLEADRGMTRYAVDVNWMGCWNATRTAGPITEFTPAEKDGCIQLGDVIQIENFD